MIRFILALLFLSPFALAAGNTTDMADFSGSLWSGLKDTFSIGGDLSILGILGLLFVVGLLFVRHAEFGLIVAALLFFVFLGVNAGVVPFWLTTLVFILAGGILILVVKKAGGGG